MRSFFAIGKCPCLLVVILVFATHPPTVEAQQLPLRQILPPEAQQVQVQQRLEPNIVQRTQRIDEPTDTTIVTVMGTGINEEGALRECP